MTSAVKRSLAVVVLFGLGAYCAFTAVMMAQLSPYPAPRSARFEFYLLAVGFLTFIGLGIWQLVVLLKKHGSENFF